ncbi:chorion peroxidase-like [Haemaphysalis longicornis]
MDGVDGTAGGAAERYVDPCRGRVVGPSENATKEIDKVVKVAATKMACVAELCRERKPKRCDAKKPYREADGTCNNLENPEWGAAGACMRRMLPQIYSDGVSSPRVSRRSGEPLPSARLVSYTAHPQGFASDERMSRMMQRFGQFVAHDISSALVIDAEGPEFFQNLGRDTYKCCDPTQSSDPECYRIDIPEQDPFYAQFNNTCMNFRRAAPCLTCKLGPREQVNALTSYIDGSPIYGISEVQTRRLRFLQKGDRRGNQNFGILSMHITWFREHNRIARNLALINPHWDDERLFQVTRRIVEARLQHIVYNELLEEILGPEVMKREQLRPRRDGYTKYNPSVDATVVNEFTTAAFRLGHALVGRDPDVKLPGDVPLRYQFFHPFAFYNAGFPDAFITKRLNEPVQKFGRYGDPEVTRHLFRFANGPKPFGVDLFAFDVQRGRDHGLRSYADFVEHCVPGVRIESFRDLEQLMPTDAVDVFERLYKDVRDVDLFSAGLAESGSHVVGPTFTCLIAPMFAKLKFGDRFYYEHGGQAGSFTPGK